MTGWPVFWVLALAMLVVELRMAATLDWSSAADLRWLMRMNWRLAAPVFLVVFTASPLRQIFPNRRTRWLQANRRYFGLAFALGASFQVPPIIVMSLWFSSDMAEIHQDSSQYGEDALYLAIVLMAVTSFPATSRWLSATAWKQLHSAGLHLVGGLYAASYAYLVLNETRFVYVLLGVGFALAWTLRAAVWWRRRAEFRAWRLFRGMAALSSGAMLACWSYFGIQDDRGVGVILDVAVAIACVMAGMGAVGTTLALLRLPLVPTLVAERRYFLGIVAVASLWYIVFALAARGLLHPSHDPPLPVPLWVAVAAAVIGAASMVRKED